LPGPLGQCHGASRGQGVFDRATPPRPQPGVFRCAGGREGLPARRTRQYCPRQSRRAESPGPVPSAQQSAAPRSRTEQRWPEATTAVRISWDVCRFLHFHFTLHHLERSLPSDHFHSGHACFYGARAKALCAGEPQRFMCLRVTCRGRRPKGFVVRRAPRVAELRAASKAGCLDDGSIDVLLATPRVSSRRYYRNHG